MRNVTEQNALIVLIFAIVCNIEPSLIILGGFMNNKFNYIRPEEANYIKEINAIVNQIIEFHNKKL